MDSKKSGSTGVCLVLFLIFLVLKLSGLIAWSWLWVCSPLWIPFAFALVCFILAGICVFIANLFD